MESLVMVSKKRFYLDKNNIMFPFAFRIVVHFFIYYVCMYLWASMCLGIIWKSNDTCRKLLPFLSRRFYVLSSSNQAWQQVHLPTKQAVLPVFENILPIISSLVFSDRDLVWQKYWNNCNSRVVAGETRKAWTIFKIFFQLFRVCHIE